MCGFLSSILNFEEYLRRWTARSHMENVILILAIICVKLVPSFKFLRIAVSIARDVREWVGNQFCGKQSFYLDLFGILSNPFPTHVVYEG